MRLALLLIVAVSSPAFAEIFTGRDGLHFSLAEGKPVPKEEADLRVTPFGIEAKYGVRRDKRQGELQTNEVTVLGDTYRVQDQDGGQWRLWVKTVVGHVVVAELLKIVPEERVERILRPVSVTIDGKSARPSTFQPLTLYPNNSYRYGTVTGRYSSNDWGVTLDGVAGQWGRAAYTVKGDGLVFKFLRGVTQYEVRFESASRREDTVSLNWP